MTNGECVLKERLDRALLNEEWCDVWPNSQIGHFPNIGPDHCSILVSCDLNDERFPKLFCFEEKLRRDPECIEVVSNCWGDAASCSTQKHWKKKLYLCKNGLLKWSKEKFGNSKMQISSLMSEVSSLQAYGSYSVHKDRMEPIVQQLDELWSREEIHWHQRSRVRWLQFGDKNSRFFHLSTIQRRKRNVVTKIKNSDGIWLEDRKEVITGFGEYFQNLFSSDGERDCTSVLDCLEVKVTDDMNSDLLHPISLEEVKGSCL